MDRIRKQIITWAGQIRKVYNSHLFATGDQAEFWQRLRLLNCLKWLIEEVVTPSSDASAHMMWTQNVCHVTAKWIARVCYHFMGTLSMADKANALFIHIVVKNVRNLLTMDHIIILDFYKSISIWSVVLMSKSKVVEQFMEESSLIFANISYIDR